MQELRQIGLTEYESKVYLTLLKNGALTGNQVSKLSGVPHGRTYEVLIKLHDKGFVSITPIKPKIFQAIKPSIAIKHFLRQKQQELQKLEKTIPEQLQQLEKPKLIPPKIIEKIKVVSGMENLWKLAYYIMSTAEKEVKIMITYEKRPYQLVQLSKELIKKGVKVKYLATLMTKQGLRWMKQDIKSGAQVRYYPVEEIRLSIKDDKECLQTIINPRDPRDRISILIQSKELSKAMSHYFDVLWKKAKKI